VKLPYPKGKASSLKLRHKGWQKQKQKLRQKPKQKMSSYYEEADDMAEFDAARKKAKKMYDEKFNKVSERE